nr:MAG TPA: hypothetical protein [Caudoviricetes sp.]
MTHINKNFPVRNCKSPPPGICSGWWYRWNAPPLPPARLAAGRVGFGSWCWRSVVGGQPIPARSAASWSASLQGSAGVIRDGS